MDALLAARLRRHGLALTAVALLVVFGVAHALLFRPLVARYRRAVASGSAVAAAIDPAGAPRPIPPRVFVSLAQNSVPASDAERQLQSGALAAELMQRLARLADAHGLDVVVSEPGASVSRPEALDVRAHVGMRGRYADLVAMLDDLARDGSLVAIERLSVVPAGEQGAQTIDLWATRLVLKRSGGGR